MIIPKSEPILLPPKEAPIPKNKIDLYIKLEKEHKIDIFKNNYFRFLTKGIKNFYDTVSGGIEDPYEECLILKEKYRKLKEEDLYKIVTNKEGKKKCVYTQLMDDLETLVGRTERNKKRGKNLSSEDKKIIKSLSKEKAEKYKKDHDLQGDNILGEVPSGYFGGLNKLKDKIDESEETKMKAIRFSGNPDNPYHITNAENLHYGKVCYKIPEEAVDLWGKFTKEIENMGITLLDFIYIEYNNLLKLYNEGEIDEKTLKKIKAKYTELYGEKFVDIVKAKQLKSPKVVVSFNPFKLSNEFREYFNENLEKIRLKYSKYNDHIEKSLKSIEIKEDEYITVGKLYQIKRALLSTYMFSYKHSNVILLDIDRKSTCKGLIQLYYIADLFSECKCITVRNNSDKFGKRNHESIIIPLDKFYKDEELKPLMDLFKLMGINDTGHTYHIAKNMFNLKKFDVYLSNSDVNFLDILKDPQSNLYQATYQILHTYANLNSRIYNPEEDYFSLAKSVNLGYNTQKKYKNPNAEDKLDGVHMDNLIHFHQTIYKYLMGKMTKLFDEGSIYNTLKIKRPWLNNKYDKELDKIEVRENEDNLIEIKEEELIEYVEKKEEKEIISNSQTDIDKIRELKSKIYDLREKRNLGLNILGDYKINLYSSRKSIIGNIVWLIASNIAFRGCSETDITKFIEEHFNIYIDKNCNDKKIKKIIKENFKKGRDKLNSSLKYNYIQSCNGNINKKVKKIKDNIDILVNDFILHENKNVLKGHLKPHGKKNNYTDEMLLIYDILKEEKNIEKRNKAIKSILYNKLMGDINLNYFNNKNEINLFEKRINSIIENDIINWIDTKILLMKSKIKEEKKKHKQNNSKEFFEKYIKYVYNICESYKVCNLNSDLVASF